VTTRQEPRTARKRGSKPAIARTISEPGNGSPDSRLCLIGVKVDAALRREIDAYAEAHGVSRSRAAGHYLAIARETIHEREGVPAGRADELMEAVDGLRAAVDILGPPTFGMLRLLAHWASQGGTVKVSEDELLAELRSVGADEWEQAVAEAERDLQETANGTAHKGRH
jgi:hypothetical protein